MEKTSLEPRLVNYLSGERIHPGIILLGPDRDQKLVIAKNMAKFLLCETRLRSGGNHFCDTCVACDRVEKDIHPDVIVLKDRQSDTIKIDHVREVCHQVEIGPTQGPVKICIIEDCHRMNAASANAFLKTLEEPGENRHFFLLTPTLGSLLPTVISRCLQFTFKPAPRQQVCDKEVGEVFDREIAKYLSSGDPTELIHYLKDKELSVQFAQHVQVIMHDRVMETEPQAPFSHLSPRAALRTFEGALRLENQLRSNASHSLMVEQFLRTQLADHS